ncbi:hypothetical protein [Streptococcus orisasini]|nr:hypothetical protein [Streptococcus orisasini]
MRKYNSKLSIEQPAVFLPIILSLIVTPIELVLAKSSQSLKY